MKLQMNYYQEQEPGTPAATTSEEKSKVRIEGLDFELDKDILGEPEGTPDNGAPDEQKPGADAQTGQPSHKGELPEDFVKRYKDKSPDELLTTLYESQKQIGKLGNKLGEQKKTVDNTLEKLNEEKDDIARSIRKLKEKIEEDFDEEIDKEDPDYKKLTRDLARKEAKLKETEKRLREAETEEIVTRTMYRKHNKEFLEGQREKVKDELDLDDSQLTDEIWDDISARAQQLAGPGEQVTEDDVQAATIKALGVNTYRTLVNNKAKQEVRHDIAKASGKAMKDLKGEGTGSIKPEDLTDEQIEKTLESLYKAGKEKEAEQFVDLLKAKDRM